MASTPARTRRRIRWLVCRGIAWAICLGALLSATSILFRGVDGEARAALAVWRAKKRSADGELFAIVRDTRPPLALADGVIVKQELRAAHDGLCALRLETVRTADPPEGGPVTWRLVEMVGDGQAPILIRSGTLDGAAGAAGGWLDIPFAPIATSAGGHYMLKLVAPAERPSRPLALAVHTTPEACEPYVVSPGPTTAAPPQPAAIGTTLHMWLRYTASAPSPSSP